MWQGAPSPEHIPPIREERINCKASADLFSLCYGGVDSEDERVTDLGGCPQFRSPIEWMEYHGIFS